MRNLVDDPKYQDVLVEHRRLLANWSKTSSDKDSRNYLKNG